MCGLRRAREWPVAAPVPRERCLVALLAGLALQVTACGLTGGQPQASTGVPSIPARSPQVQGAPADLRSPTPGPGPSPTSSPSPVGVGFARGDPAALPGVLLIADRDNSRLLEVDGWGHVLWQFPSPGVAPGPTPFTRPDDAFYSPDRSLIATNEEFEHTVIVVDRSTGKEVWSYGHPYQPGSAPGYLNGPDDAFLLPSGDVLVADIKNCRILQLAPSKSVVRQLGGICHHAPPRGLGSPNGDFPLADGGMLVTEINGAWVDRFDADWRLVASVRVPAAYPSDAQLLPNGNILVADWIAGGSVMEVDWSGRVVWRFGPVTGPYRLNHPSIALRLPNGMVALADDWNDRVLIVDPQRNQVVWEYGHLGVPGSQPGYLSTPDGLDFRPAELEPGQRRIRLPR